LISPSSPLDFLAAFAIVLVAGALLGIGLAWGRTGAPSDLTMRTHERTARVNF